MSLVENIHYYQGQRMKFFFLVLFSVSAFAQESIELTSNKLEITEAMFAGKDSISLIRTALTPNEVEISVPTKPSGECVKTEIQSVNSSHPSCGSYTVPSCRNESYNCETLTRCKMWVGSAPTCAMEEFYQVCDNRNECSDETRDISCYHDAEVCVV
jgi:hypothetical protein